MKFVVFVEGDTERAVIPDFLRRWLNPQLSKPAGVNPIQFKGCHRFIKEIAKNAQLRLNGPGAETIIGCIGLLDLYGFPGFPDQTKSVEARHEWAVREIRRRFDHPKFRMHFAVHELEAWILSEPHILPEPVARALPAKAREPETVDFETPPKKLLKRLYRDKHHADFKELVHGKGLFRKLNPAVAGAKCPYPKAMLNDMLRMAREAGL